MDMGKCKREKGNQTHSREHGHTGPYRHTHTHTQRERERERERERVYQARKSNSFINKHKYIHTDRQTVTP